MRQGDPISPILFNSVSQNVFGILTSQWEQDEDVLLVGVDGKQRLTKLRFADDVVLFSSSKQDIQGILTLMKIECEKGIDHA